MKKRIAKLETAAAATVSRRQRHRAELAKAEAWQIKTNPVRFHELMQRYELSLRTPDECDVFWDSLTDGERGCCVDYRDEWLQQQAELVDHEDLQRRIDGGTLVSELATFELMAILDASKEGDNA